MLNKSKVISRQATLEERQKSQHWGPLYQPAILAARGEAPSKSIPCCMPSRLGRSLHLLSKAEKTLCTLALYNPALWDLHEQHALTWRPAPHPLSCHPFWRGYSWPASSGTVRISEELGILQQHPRIFVSAGDEGRWMVVSFIGDLLLYMQDAIGPYLLSWDCKAKMGDHGMPGPEKALALRTKRDHQKAEVRERIYQRYMAELGIRIVQVAGAQIDVNVARTLSSLCGLHTRVVELTKSHRDDLAAEFANALVQGNPPLTVIQKKTRNLKDSQQAVLHLKQLIWNRSLRVDLFSTIEIDHPLRPESQDVLATYEALFRRTA